MSLDDVNLVGMGTGNEFIRPTKYATWFRFEHESREVVTAEVFPTKLLQSITKQSEDSTPASLLQT